MKKLLSIVLTLTLVSLLSGCSNPASENSSSKKESSVDSSSQESSEQVESSEDSSDNASSSSQKTDVPNTNTNNSSANDFVMDYNGDRTEQLKTIIRANDMMRIEEVVDNLFEQALKINTEVEGWNYFEPAKVKWQDSPEEVIHYYDYIFALSENKVNDSGNTALIYRIRIKTHPEVVTQVFKFDPNNQLIAIKYTIFPREEGFELICKDLYEQSKEIFSEPSTGSFEDILTDSATVRWLDESQGSIVELITEQSKTDKDDCSIQLEVRIRTSPDDK